MEPNESLHHIAPTAILKHTNQVGKSLLYVAISWDGMNMLFAGLNSMRI